MARLMLRCLLPFAALVAAAGIRSDDPRFARADDAVASGNAPSRADAEFFEKSIRPLLATRCHKCHGAKRQEFGLRLDSREAMLKGGDGGPAVVVGKPDESPLIEAVRHAGSIRMPPDGRLTDAEVASLTEWVRRGAPWPQDVKGSATKSIEEAAREHWAFRPVRRPVLPTVQNAEWVRTPIDRFILAKLEAAGMGPSAEGDRVTLVRRLSFDLIGLPPTPEEVDAFIADESPEAYERLVDRLLASPHYGERWGRYWLDVARFADTKGYVFFESVKYPWAWTYRDYVIRALNDDVPYDQFVREQIAADQMEGGSPESLAAMGFLTCGNHYMGNQHDILDDRIDVVARGLMGLTVGCARCHDHKFDPIPSADYYSLYGIFRSSQEPLVPPLLTAPPATDAYRNFEKELRNRVFRFDNFVGLKFQELANGGRTRAGEYLAKAHALRNQPTTEDFMLITDKGDLNPVMIIRWQKYLEETKKSRHPVWAAWHLFAAIDDAPVVASGASAAGAAANDRTFASRAREIVAGMARPEGTSHPVNPLVRAEFVGRPVPQSMAEVIHRYAALLARIDREWIEVPALAESPGDDITPLAAKRLPNDAAEEVRQVLYGPDAPPNLPRMLGWGFLSLIPDRASQDEFKKLIGEVENWMTTGAGAPARSMALVDDAVPFEPRVFLRGNPNRPGAAVPRTAPGIVNRDRKPFHRGSGRRELAEAIVHRDNPLTARVMANRVWMHHFGQGLVATAGDFGLRSDPPTHPELLDWLAAELSGGEGERGSGGVDSANQSAATESAASPLAGSPPFNPQSEIRNPQSWSLKHLHRQIVLSAVYRQQSSVPQPSTLNPRPSPDPENRLLCRMNRRRLDFEALRDSLVAVSGSLDETIGGPSVDILAGFSPRRTLYGHIDRQDLATLYRDYDFPDPSASSPQREATTVPPQALFLMNNAFAQTAATRVLSRQDVRSASAAEAKLDRIARLLFARPLTDRERPLALDFLGPNPDDQRWQQFLHALLLTNEFAFVD